MHAAKTHLSKLIDRAAAGAFVDVPGGEGSTAHRAVASPVRFGSDDHARPRGGVPGLGEHTDEVLREL